MARRLHSSVIRLGSRCDRSLRHQHNAMPTTVQWTHNSRAVEGSLSANAPSRRRRLLNHPRCKLAPRVGRSGDNNRRGVPHQQQDRRPQRHRMDATLCDAVVNRAREGKSHQTHPNDDRAWPLQSGPVVNQRADEMNKGYACQAKQGEQHQTLVDLRPMSIPEPRSNQDSEVKDVPENPNAAGAFSSRVGSGEPGGALRGKLDVPKNARVASPLRSYPRRAWPTTVRAPTATITTAS